MTTTMQDEQSAAVSPPVHRVLIIAEVPYQAFSLQRLLEEMGTEAILAFGQEAGIAYLSLVRVDTVVLDVDLGVTAVHDLCVRLRRDCPETQVAVLVGWWDERVADVRACSDALICKPVHPQQLREALARPAQ